MKNIVIAFTLLLGLVGFSQKVKIKDGFALVDKVQYLKVKEDKVDKNNYTISTLSGEDIFYLRFNYFTTPSRINNANPDGKTWYFEVMTPDLEKTYYETWWPVTDMIKDLYNAEVIGADGKVSQEKLELLAKKKGFEFTKMRNGR